MRCNTQFIAALGDPVSSKGSGARNWGIWRIDPGPRGVHIQDWSLLKMMGGLAPSGWKFDAGDWWLEEHGLIMEKPDTPLPSGRHNCNAHQSEGWVGIFKYNLQMQVEGAFSASYLQTLLFQCKDAVCKQKIY